MPVLLQPPPSTPTLLASSRGQGGQGVVEAGPFPHCQPFPLCLPSGLRQTQLTLPACPAPQAPDKEPLLALLWAVLVYRRSPEVPGLAWPVPADRCLHQEQNHPRGPDPFCWRLGQSGRTRSVKCWVSIPLSSC